MKIVFLEAKRHPLNNSEWHYVEITQPTWEEIESAIRRLNRDEWPVVYLHSELPTQQDQSTENMLFVVGGLGEYQLCLYRDNQHTLFTDPSRSLEPVQIYESNQADTAKYRLCNDIYRVLELVRFFALTGELSPDANWIEW